MMERIRNRRMTNLFGFAARSLLSRPWYSIAHTVLLSVSMSSFYLMLTLAFLIPPEWSGNFGFFQRGGLEASTDLLIFASAALLFSLCIVPRQQQTTIASSEQSCSMCGKLAEVSHWSGVRPARRAQGTAITIAPSGSFCQSTSTTTINIMVLRANTLCSHRELLVSNY